MTLALTAVLVAALCSGGAAVLQAGAARRLPPAHSLAAGFMVRLLRNPLYLLALVLIISSFGLSILALRTLPLFVVQAGRASSLAVTALLGVLVLGVRLRRTEVVAVLGIAAGLVLLGLSSGPQGRQQLKLPGEFVLPCRGAGDRPCRCGHCPDGLLGTRRVVSEHPRRVLFWAACSGCAPAPEF